MLPRLFPFTTLSFFAATASFAQGLVPEKLLTAPGYETVAGLIRTHDNGFLHVGSTTSFGAGQYDVYLMKTDSSENIEWIRSYGGPLDDVGSQVKQTADSGFIITAATKSFGMGGYDGYVIRTDAQGSVLWQRTVGGAQDDVLSRSVIVNDSNYAFAGFSKSIGAGDADFWILQMNDLGDTLWTSVFGDSGYDAIVTINPAAGGFICSGRTTSVSGFFFNAVIIKTGFKGIPLWTNVYGGPGSAEAMYVKETHDHGFIATGATNSFAGGGNHDVFTIKTDSMGNLDWARLYGGANVDASYDLIQTADSGFIIVGFTESYNAITPRLAGALSSPAGGDSANVFIIRTDAAGDTLWTRAIGGNQFDEGYNLIPWDANGCVVSAYSKSFSGSDTTDIYLLKVDAQGNAGCHARHVYPVVTAPPVSFSSMNLSFTSGLTVTVPAATQATFSFGFSDPCFGVGVDESQADYSGKEIFVYPNPFTDSFTVQFKDGDQAGRHESVIEVYNNLGEKLFQKFVFPDVSYQLKFKNMQPGVYFLKLTSGPGTVVKKIVSIY